MERIKFQTLEKEELKTINGGVHYEYYIDENGNICVRVVYDSDEEPG